MAKRPKKSLDIDAKKYICLATDQRKNKLFKRSSLRKSALSNLFANSAFVAEHKADKARTTELKKYINTGVWNDSDGKRDLKQPICDAFLSPVKPLEIQKMTDFGPAKV